MFLFKYSVRRAENSAQIISFHYTPRVFKNFKSRSDINTSLNTNTIVKSNVLSHVRDFLGNLDASAGMRRVFKVCAIRALQHYRIIARFMFLDHICCAIGKRFKHGDEWDTLANEKQTEEQDNRTIQNEHRTDHDKRARITDTSPRGDLSSSHAPKMSPHQLLLRHF